MSEPPLYQLSKEDQELWSLFTKEIDVFEQESCEESFEALLKEGEKEALKPTQKILHTKRKITPYQSKKEYDLRTKERLGKGKLSVERVLDLHGYYQEEAKNHVMRFIKESYDMGMRVVLIITGKGRFSPQGKSVLKQALPEWLEINSLKEIVLSYRSAKQEDGGSGAYYILIKKKT